MNDIIQFENVVFSYDERQRNALEGVSFSVKEGEFLAILGHNGSGKSTLARLVNGLLSPNKGSVKVMNMYTSCKENIFEIRKNVGIVFQNPDNQMVASIVEDDIAFGPENIGVEREEIGRRIDFALKAVGMEKYRHSTPTRLSGGQKQRIAIAGALAIKPKILILDESTAMLDPRGRKEVMQVVRRLNKEEGMTIILITHFMEEALMADRAIVMSEGHVVMQDVPENIFERSDELEKYGLSLPGIGYICKKLQESGIAVKNVLSPDLLAEDICELLQKI